MGLPTALLVFGGFVLLMHGAPAARPVVDDGFAGADIAFDPPEEEAKIADLLDKDPRTKFFKSADFSAFYLFLTITKV